MRILKIEDFQRQAWANGRGSTLELVREPAKGRYTLRLSVAEVLEDGAFSDFAGYRRALAVLDGTGLQLRFADASTLAIRQFESQQFPGAPGPWCTLLGTKVQDFNAIYDPTQIQLELTVVDLLAGDNFEVLGEHSALYLLSGTLEAPCALVPGELLLLQGKQALGGVGRMVVVQYKPCDRNGVRPTVTSPVALP